MSNRVVPEAMVDLYFLVRLLFLFNRSSNNSSSRVVVSVVVSVFNYKW